MENSTLTKNKLDKKFYEGTHSFMFMLINVVLSILKICLTKTIN